jgi:hypothetical protein
MKKLITSLSLLLLFASVAFGQSLPSPAFSKVTIGSATTTVLYPTVPSNSALTSLATTTTPIVTRLGYTTSGDAPPLNYAASGSACSLNSGAGDNGSQVEGSNGLCWIAAFPSVALDVREWGATPNGSTDSTAAINAANTYAASSSRSLYLPGPTYVVSAVTFSAPKVFGDGWQNGTNIQTNSASANAVTVGSNVILSDMEVSSSIAEASRTGAGVKVTGSFTQLRDIYSVGHKYGIWNQGNANEFEHCFGQTNNSHGIFLDGSVNPQNEIGIYYSQSNGNGGDGFHIVGPGTGIFMVRPTAASNTGGGIVAVNSVGGSTNAVNDVFITQPEMSTNGGNNIDFSSDSGGSGLTVSGGLVEIAGDFGIDVGNGFATTSIGGGLIIGGWGSSGAGILFNGQGASIGNVTLGGNNGAAIHLGANSTLTSISGVQALSSGGTLPIGLQLDSGGGAVRISGSDFSQATSPFTGNLPSGSLISAVGGMTPMETGTSSATTSSAYGALFASSGVSVTFPTAYPSGYIPKVTTVVNGTSGAGISTNVTVISNTGFTFFAIGAGSGGVVPVTWTSN